MCSNYVYFGGVGDILFFLCIIQKCTDGDFYVQEGTLFLCPLWYLVSFNLGFGSVTSVLCQVGEKHTFSGKNSVPLSVWMLSENVIWARLSDTLIDDSNAEFWKEVNLHGTYFFKVLEMYKASDFCSTFDHLSF
jgi:hypothetical protein